MKRWEILEKDVNDYKTKMLNKMENIEKEKVKHLRWFRKYFR